MDKVCAKKMIKALTIDERRSVLKNIHSENDNVAIWKGVKGKLSLKEMEQVIKLRGMSLYQFNNTIQDISIVSDEKVLQKLESMVSNSEWFQVFEEAMNIELDGMVRKEDVIELLSPFVMWGRKYIKKHIKNLRHVVIDVATFRQIEQYMYETLFSLSMKVFVYEYNKEKNKRAGKRYTIQEHVKNYLDSKDEIITFFYEYPVLARRLSTKIKYIAKNISIMIKHVDQKFDEIQNKYHINSKKMLSIECGKGDTHRKGRTVSILRFGDKKIVYKPYADQLGKSFNEFISIYNDFSENINLYAMNNLYYDEFAIYEYIEQIECKTPFQVNCYYHRIGQMLFILYILGASDIHCENIVAHGAFPVIVDCETVIGNYSYTQKNQTAFDILNKWVADSVLNSGVLPLDIKGINLGGLNALGKTQKIEHEVLCVQDDENMFFEKKFLEIGAEKNNPIYQGKVQEYFSYVSDIINGFEHAYFIFLSYKEKINQNLTNMISNRSRVILQATQNYADVMEFCSHPQYLMDMLDMEKLFENVVSPFWGVSEVLLYEVRDLIEGDIPIFFAEANNTNLVTSRNEKISDFFEHTIYDSMQYKIQNLSKTYEQQRKILLYYLGCSDSLNYDFWNQHFNNSNNYKNLECIDLIYWLEDKISRTLSRRVVVTHLSN